MPGEFVQKFSTLNDLTILFLFGAVFWNQNKIENTCGRALPFGQCIGAGRLRDRSVNSIFDFCIHILFLLLKYYQSHKKIIIICTRIFSMKNPECWAKSHKNHVIFLCHMHSWIMMLHFQCATANSFLIATICFLDFQCN